MCRLKYYNSIFSTICLLGTVSFAIGALADGDPAEFAQTEVTTQVAVTSSDQNGTLLPDEQVAPPEEAVATVTADGDFLLPTYLLPGETATVERTTTVEKVYEKTPTKIATVKVPVAQQTTIEHKTTTRTVEPDDFQTLLTQTKAALPPASAQPLPPPPPPPQPIRVQVPQPVPPTFPAAPVPNSQIVIQDRVELPTVEVQGTRTVPVRETAAQDVRPFPQPSGTTYEAAATIPPPPSPAKAKLLIPLAPVPKIAVSEPSVPVRERVIVPNEYADQVTAGLKSGQPVPFHMPHEIRITFYPQESAFSGQTLKWIRAFAWAALQDPRLIVEVRASCAEADLQDARLKLVQGVLMGAGLSMHQIVVNYTNRPVDTMLLRAVPRPEATETVLAPKDIRLPKNMSRVKKW